MKDNLIDSNEEHTVTRYDQKDRRIYGELYKNKSVSSKSRNDSQIS